MLANKIWILLGIFFFISCTDKPLKIIHAECGSSVTMTGTITNTSLSYTFKPCTHCKTLKDVCNYIYFQGDTLCFSIHCNQNIEHAAVTAYFENPLTHAIYKAERVEKVKTTVYGFSLVGSLLEKLYFTALSKNYPFKTIALPFTIYVTIEKHNSRAQYALANTMYVEFPD